MTPKLKKQDMKTKQSTKHGTTNKRSFQKREKVESSSQDWEKEFDKISQGYFWCGCYEGDLDNRFPAQQKKVKSFISYLLKLKEKEVVEKIKDWIKTEEYWVEVSGDLKVVSPNDLLDFLNKEYKVLEYKLKEKV